MGMGGTGNFCSGINGNEIEVSEFQLPGIGMGMKSRNGREWDAKVISAHL